MLPGGSASLTHALARYGNVPILNQGGSVTLNSATIEHANLNGVQNENNGTLNIQNSTIRNNGGYGLYYVAGSSAAPVLQNTSFQNNTGYAIYFNLPVDVTLDGSGMSGNSAIQ